MKRINLSEQRLNSIISSSIKRVLRESFDKREEMLQDAIDSLENGLAYDEWSPAYEDVDEDELIEIWNEACDDAGYEEYKEDDYSYNGNDDIAGLDESVTDEWDVEEKQRQYEEDREAERRWLAGVDDEDGLDESRISRAVNEAFDMFNNGGMDTLGGMDMHDGMEEDSHKKAKKEGKKKEDKEGKKDSNGKSKRSIVISWLKDPSVNCAEIMRKLWSPDSDEEDAARSYFYKCRDGKLNDSGVPYRFSDEDINALYNLKSKKS